MLTSTFLLSGKYLFVSFNLDFENISGLTIKRESETLWSLSNDLLIWSSLSIETQGNDVFSSRFFSFVFSCSWLSFSGGWSKLSWTRDSPLLESFLLLTWLSWSLVSKLSAAETKICAFELFSFFSLEIVHISPFALSLFSDSAISIFNSLTFLVNAPLVWLWQSELCNVKSFSAFLLQ